MIKGERFWKIVWDKFFFSGPMIFLYIFLGLATVTGIVILIAVNNLIPWFLGLLAIITIVVWIQDVYERAEYTHRTGYNNPDEEEFDKRWRKIDALFMDPPKKGNNN